MCLPVVKVDVRHPLAYTGERFRGHVNNVKETILIVDDEPDITEVLSDVVAEAGYRAVSARHGRQALEILERERPALMLLDVMMPVMSGEDLLAELDRRGILRDVPIIVMSAGECSPLAEQYGLPYLRKPTSVRGVLQLIATALAASRRAGAGESPPRS